MKETVSTTADSAHAKFRTHGKPTATRLPLVQLTVLLVALLFHVTTLRAATSFTSDGIKYIVTSTTDKTVKVAQNTITEYKGDIVIPSTVTYNSVTYTVTEVGANAFKSLKEVTSVTLPETVTVIGADAFYQCINMTSINLPTALTTIGDYTFYLCKNLGNVTIPNTVTSLGKYAFYDCESFSKLTIPTGLTAIPEGAFCSCSNIYSVTIPEGVTTIGDGAFSGIILLKEINFPSTLTTIGLRAFSSCWLLRTLNIPNTITTIGAYAFDYCPNLATVYISGSVTSIPSTAFDRCSKITSVYLDCETPPAFEGCFNYETTTVYVPTGSLAAYQQTAWSSFKLAEYDMADGIDIDGTGVSTVTMKATPVRYYTVGGRQVDSPVKGVNIIRMSDGRTRKVIIKK